MADDEDIVSPVCNFTGQCSCRIKGRQTRVFRNRQWVTTDTGQTQSSFSGSQLVAVINLFNIKYCRSAQESAEALDVTAPAAAERAPRICFPGECIAVLEEEKFHELAVCHHDIGRIN